MTAQRRSTGPQPGARGRVLVGLLTTIAAGTALAAAGLRVMPSRLPDYPQPSQPTTRYVPLPGDLPAPVHRWLTTIYGSEVPVIDSVVATGRARVNPFGVWMPARFRFIHDAGRGYRHDIEATWFGRPILRVDERYVDGRSVVRIPLIGHSAGPKVEQAANIGMWAELATAAPAVLVTDPRVVWRPIGPTSATLSVPFGDSGRDELSASFDERTGMLRRLQAWRYRSAQDDQKMLWTAAVVPGTFVAGSALPAVGTATWADQGRPWARFTTEDLRTNVDVAGDLEHGGAVGPAKEHPAVGMEPCP